jgi:type IV pilus biogenesis protein CpaD/CtpE
MSHSIRLTIAVLGVLGGAGCTWRDPYLRNDVWKPTGSNPANLAAMIADPRDLAHGRGGGRVDTKADVLAVERIYEGRPQSLGGGGSVTRSAVGAGEGSGGPAPPPGG